MILIRVSLTGRSGRMVPEYEIDEVRQVIESSYRIIYLIKEDQLEVLAVVHTCGQLQRLSRSTLRYEPHADFISPRFIDTSSRSSDYNMREAFWLKKNPR